MMDTLKVSETSNFDCKLTRLVAQEDLIPFSPHKTFKSFTILHIYYCIKTEKSKIKLDLMEIYRVHHQNKNVHLIAKYYFST
jgi:hypothetical protein